MSYSTLTMSRCIICVLITVLMCASYTKGLIVDGKHQGFTRVPHEGISADVTVMHLQFNSLTVLGPFEFSNYTKLEACNLNKNDIRTVSDLAFVNTPLTTMLLSSNELTSFPNLTVVANTLAYLDVSGNSIASIDGDLLSQLVNIIFLQLTDNPLITWPDFTGVGRKIIKRNETVAIELKQVCFICFLQIHYCVSKRLIIVFYQ